MTAFVIPARDFHFQQQPAPNGRGLSGDSPILITTQRAQHVRIRNCEKRARMHSRVARIRPRFMAADHSSRCGASRFLVILP
jgi:hypothetical protein